ncbi:branched-chain amino acid transport system permease protein [Gemmobacter aquatilis]|uniref:Branched-chain amino acid transport system permease protein n=1 Tax=Gemmobacter aquatilis TaxID=933059 RepID=A0A1H8JQR2_9RHOB|nr:branched-chain amino acid ABC transporter permease [Gemmobacter aquatilis]SEN82528.1 branched-chain amino acid transport system permease protein [Gemmobacter aquatilis]
MLTDLLGIPPQVLFGQLLLGLINGAFYAVLSLGLAVIFGLLNIVNFSHGALYMLGAFATLALVQFFGIGYWGALVLAPLMVGALGIVIERLLLRRLVGVDHLYGLLLTFGLALVIEGTFVKLFGASGIPYAAPAALSGGVNLGFMFLPWYRAWVVLASVVVCLATWLLFERTKIGAYLRAGTENPKLLQAFGVNVPMLTTLAYGYGVALAAFAGVLAAPITQVNPLMGSNLIIVVFAVVVIGGMGSIIGAIVTGLAMGMIEGLTKVFWPEASATVIFLVMAIVLILRPAGLFGKTA